eukprot:10961299-Alexandrium_andersonii.AAC.1
MHFRAQLGLGLGRHLLARAPSNFRPGLRELAAGALQKDGRCRPRTLRQPVHPCRKVLWHMAGGAFAT